MRGAIGNAMVMNIVITFIILTTAFLVSSISYSKAFKVKTKIIDIIEKYDGDFNKTSNKESVITNEINQFLGQTGYRTTSATAKGDCSKYVNSSKGESLIATTSSYDICIIQKNNNSSIYHGPYYKVVVYMYFDFPIIGDMIKIPVSGETRSFFKDVKE